MDKKTVNKLIKYQTDELYDSYNYLGAHIVNNNGEKGVSFTVWAPNASKVALVGTFNYWDDTTHIMEKIKGTGYWNYYFDGIGEGEIYKYKIYTEDGKELYKSDPYAFYSEIRPNTSSIVYELDKYKWNDSKWIQNRKKIDNVTLPMNIYEVHLGSWRTDEEGKFLNYKQIAEELVPYLKQMNYTHVEILPLMEHPLDASWGYQTTGYYSVTSRYGTPDDLMYLVDKLHQNNISVIFDWVPGHFCRDEHGLMNFDGKELYGNIDHPNWGTKKFDFSKREVKNFLISNALFYFDKYHVDGLRVDGVTSVLLLNFGLDGTPYKNRLGGTDDLDGIDFFKDLNTEVFKKYPFAVMAAEESSAWPLVTYPVDSGGLGFNFKWNMGWMNDSLSYISCDPIYRKFEHGRITFGLHYAFSENFILPYSHDEVVHGKKSLVDRYPGSYEDKFKNLKLLAIFQMTHPGKKLNFMGNEIAQFIEWRYYEQLEWFLLKYPIHDSHNNFIKKLNKLYLSEPSLWTRDNDWSGFQWVDVNNADQSIFSYIRWTEDDFVEVILNFTPVAIEKYRLGVPFEGQYRVILNSDDAKYNGSGTSYKSYSKAQPIPTNGQPFSIEIGLPGLTGLILKKRKSKKIVKKS